MRWEESYTNFTTLGYGPTLITWSGPAITIAFEDYVNNELPVT